MRPDFAKTHLPQTLQDLQTDAKTIADTTAKAAGCAVKKVMIQRACSQIVAGTNYEYSAQLLMKCGKRTKPTTFTRTLLVPAVGK